MSAEWKDTTLGQICTAQGGAIQTGPFGSQLHTSDYKEFGIPVVMPTNIGDGGIVEDGIARIDQTDVDRLSQHKLRIGDIVFSRRGDVTKNALIRPHEVGWFCGTGCLKVRLGDESIATAKFISHCLRLPDIKDWLIRHAVGATMPNLNTGILSAVPIFLPPLHVQLEIATTLGALDDRIALLRETNATLEAIAQALFKSWFVDFDPVRAKLEGRAPEGMDEATARLFPDSFEESELGLVPRGWRVGRVSDLGNVICGKTPPTAQPENYGDDVPFITIPDMHSVLVVTATNRSLSRVGADTQKKKYLPPGSICISCIATPGLVVRVTVAAQTNQQINSVVPLEHWGKAFPLFLLRRIGDAVRAGGSGGSVFHNLSKSGFEELKVLLTTSELAQRFDEVIEPLVSKIVGNQKQAQTLATLRDTLLPRLISGALRLPEAQAAAEEALA
jgi:type I restriction enzyme S subunit